MTHEADYCKQQIKVDCEELLTRFQQTESVRYDIFSTIWREMKFSNIFYGRFEGKEKRTFSCQVLATAFSYLLPPYTFQIRVGGLYLLYGLYHSQLFEPREKIRLALSDWEDIRKFEQDAINAQHFDVVYILRKLLAEKAFHFTATARPLTFKVKRTIARQRPCEEFMDRPMRPQELVSMDMLDELSNVHEHYEQLKAAISATPGQADPAPSVIRKELVPQLRDAVMEYYQWQNKQKHQDSGETADEDGGEGTSDQQECSRRAELLASIKSKSYGQQVEASRSRRHRQVELEVTSHETGPPEESQNRKRRKKSLKERTSKMLLNKVGNIMEDTYGKPWCLSEAEVQRISERKSIQKKFKW